MAAQRRHASSTPPLGFIGLGKIGSGMVINLIKADDIRLMLQDSGTRSSCMCDVYQMDGEM